MDKKLLYKVGIFFFIIILAAIFIIFAPIGRSSSVDTTEYEKNIRLLNDTIKKLELDIKKYKEEIAKIDLERNTIKKELEQILIDNEKTDTELSNGDWDYNIRFLSDYLSEKDSLGE